VENEDGNVPTWQKDMCKIVNGSQTKLVTPTLHVDWEKTNGKVRASIHKFENYESFSW
jgi:hypothetical protein